MANTIPSGSTPISTAVSGTTGGLTLVLGTNAYVGRTIYLTGFNYQASGATAAATITITLQYTPITGSLVTLGTWVYPISNTAATIGVPLVINLIPPFASPAPVTGVNNITTASATGSLVLQISAAGAGATFAGVNAWGYAW